MNDFKTAQLLVELRKQHKLTQNDLAQKLNISYQAVSKWERGENLPDTEMMLDIASFYNITVDELLRGELLPTDSLKQQKHRKNVMMIAGIVIIIFSVIPFLFLMQSNLYLGIALIIGISAVGTVLVVISSLIEITGKSKSEVEFDRVRNIVYPLCFVIFFYVSMKYGVWYISWLIFVVGYAITMFFKKE